MISKRLLNTTKWVFQNCAYEKNRITLQFVYLNKYGQYSIFKIEIRINKKI